VFAVAPQTRRWCGATTLQRDLLTLIQEKVRLTLPGANHAEIKSTCPYADKPAPYTQKAFDQVTSSHVEHFSEGLTIVRTPEVIWAAVIHAPLVSCG